MKRLFSLFLILSLAAPSAALAASCCPSQAPEARLAMSADCCCPEAVMCDGAQTDADASPAVTVPSTLQTVLTPLSNSGLTLNVAAFVPILFATASPPGLLASFLSLPLRL